MQAAQPAIVCPQCGSTRYFKGGVRRLASGGEKQRYICRDCGYRYVTENLNVGGYKRVCSQISAAKRAKNLAPATALKPLAGDAKLTAETKGLLVKYCQYLEKEGYCETITYPNLIKYLAQKGANILDPETVKETIAKLTYVNRHGETVKAKNGTKMLYCAAYDVFAKMLGIQWQKPSYKQEEITVYVPYESELDALISGARSRRMTAYLQTLKETFADPSEALRIRWQDVDCKNHTIAINFPVKGHYAGTIPVSPKLIAMLTALPKSSERVFPYTYSSVVCSFRRLRKRVAATLQNPRILNVELRGFRHWGGTMIAYQTNGNVLEVKRLLRHKAIASSMKYIGRIQFKNDEYDTTSATTVDEILKLGSAGWSEYAVVKVNGLEVHCFRRPKRFNGGM